MLTHGQRPLTKFSRRRKQSQRGKGHLLKPTKAAVTPHGDLHEAALCACNAARRYVTTCIRHHTAGSRQGNRANKRREDSKEDVNCPNRRGDFLHRKAQANGQRIPGAEK